VLCRTKLREKDNQSINQASNQSIRSRKPTAETAPSNQSITSRKPTAETENQPDNIIKTLLWSCHTKLSEKDNQSIRHRINQSLTENQQLKQKIDLTTA